VTDCSISRQSSPDAVDVDAARVGRVLPLAPLLPPLQVCDRPVSAVRAVAVAICASSIVER
jgi:hypothetical protein